METYSSSDFAAIGRAIGTDQSVVAQHAKRFEAAALWYRLDRRSRRHVPPYKVRKKLDQIAKTARRLLKHLAIKELRDAPDGPGDLTILDALVSAEVGTDIDLARTTERIGRLVDILDAIDAAKELERRAVKGAENVARIGALTVPKEHQGDIAVNDWIASMLAIYRDITGKEPATSVGAPGRRDEGIAGGPLIRFLAAAGGPLKIQFSEDAWRSRVRTVLGFAHEQN